MSSLSDRKCSRRISTTVPAVPGPVRDTSIVRRQIQGGPVPPCASNRKAGAAGVTAGGGWAARENARRMMSFITLAQQQSSTQHDRGSALVWGSYGVCSICESRCLATRLSGGGLARLATRRYCDLFADHVS